jgi:hypothetical protein
VGRLTRTSTKLVSRGCALGAVAACGLALSGCGSDRETSAPDVRPRVVAADRFLGFPLLAGIGNEVRTRPDAWVTASPFPLYVEPQRAVADLRSNAFVAGIIRIYKATQGAGSAGSVVVQMRDGSGAAKERKRQTAMAVAIPCPEACTKATEEFDVRGIPGAAGFDVKNTFARAVTEEGMTFKVTHDITIVFTKGAFVYQLFVGGPGMDRKRSELVDAARAQYERVP